MSRNRNVVIIAAIAVIVVIAGVWVIKAKNIAFAAGANPFATLWNDLSHPFNSQTSFNPNTGASTPGNATGSVQLYAPDDQYEADVIAAVNRVAPAVVSITISENVPTIQDCPNDFFNQIPPQYQQFFNDVPTSSPCDSGQTQLEPVGGGSGFIITSDGLILTNKHVVSDTSAQYSVLTNDGKTYTAKVLARDSNQDLAVLKIDATGLPTVTLGDSDGLQLGQTAIAIGNTLGQFSNTVSVGAVSGLGRTLTAQSPDTGAEESLTGVLQTDAAINPGNSGGPLLDLRGDVIGINTAVASDAQSVGFAIPINQAKSAIQSVESTGEIKVPYLGVRYEPVDATLASQNKLPITYGALVSGTSGQPAVAAGSPAAAAGIKSGDIIESVNGTQINAQNDLGNLIDQHSVGDTVTLVVNRKGTEMTFSVKLAERPTGT